MFQGGLHITNSELAKKDASMQLAGERPPICNCSSGRILQPCIETGVSIPNAHTLGKLGNMAAPAALLTRGVVPPTASTVMPLLLLLAGAACRARR